MRWHLESVMSVILAICALATVLIGIGGAMLRRQGESKKLLDEQLERQRRFDLTWYGSDPEYPGGPAKPGMPERVTTIEKNTQGMSERIGQVESELGEVRSRLGKHDDQLADATRRLTDVTERLTGIEKSLYNK